MPHTRTQERREKEVIPSAVRAAYLAMQMVSTHGVEI
jgi:hypothetical protein